MVLSLFYLATIAIEDGLVDFTNVLVKKESASFIDVAEQLGRLTVQMQGMPVSLHPTIAHRCFAAARRLSRSNGSAVRKFAIEYIVLIFNHLNVKKVYIEFFKQKSFNLFNTAVLDIFTKANQPVMLECRSFLNGTPNNLGNQQRIATCPNLVSFLSRVASDKLVRALCKNCPSIQEIKVFGSEEVTNASISSLVRCQQLRRVDLFNTSVSVRGYVELLADAQSPLVDIGPVDLNKLLHQLEEDVVPFRSFQLRSLNCYYGDTPDLRLVPDYFPQLTDLHVALNADDDVTNLVPDFSALDQMKHVKHVNFKLVNYPLSRSNDLLSLRSCLLTNLSLTFWPYDSHSLKINITAIKKIGIQCPNIECLELSNFPFFDDPKSLEFYSLSGKPFPKLRRLNTSHCSNVACLKVILSHAFCVESIKMYGENENANDFVEHVLNVNPLERLKTLEIEPKNNISAHLLKKVITCCKKLSKLGDFEAFVALSKEEKQEIKHLISKR